MDRDNVAGIAAGAFVVILVWAVKQFGGIEIPGEVQAAAALLISLIVTHFTPRREYSPSERAAVPTKPGDHA